MEDSEIVGRDDDREVLVNELVKGEEDAQEVRVIAVVSIGGLGNRFEKRSVLRLTRAILEQVKRANSSLSQLHSLQNELLQALRGKRFLRVLDYVRKDDASKWGTLRLPLRSGAHGSRILVTARSDNVANAVSAAYIHDLQGLSKDHSWRLFSNRSFAGRRAEECLDLESGFIQRQGNREIEVIGGECFDDLVAWSMLPEVTVNRQWGAECKMHDLLHDLAGFIAMDESRIFTGGKSNPCPTNSDLVR
ncbi:hypothetical protein ACLOJK_008340 [Asimina triloba]